MLRGYALVLVCVPFALFIGLLAMNSKNSGPWTVAFFSYGALAGIIASTHEVLGESSFKKGAGLIVLSWVLVLAATVMYLLMDHQL
jgi:hypothetical protein